MQITDAPLPAPVWAAIGGVIVAFITWLLSRGKTRAETRKLTKEGDAVELDSSIKAAEAILHLIEKLRAIERECNERGEKLAERNDRIEQLEAEVRRLRGRGNGSIKS